MYFLKIKVNQSIYTFQNNKKEKLILVFENFIKIKKSKPALLSSNVFEIKDGKNKELQSIIKGIIIN